MNIVGLVRQLILNDVDADAILDGRVFPVVLPQSTEYPATRLTVVSISGNNTKTGVASEDVAMIQVSTFGPVHSTVQEADDAIRNAIDYFTGSVTAGATTEVLQLIEFEDSQFLYEDENKMFHVMSEYRVRY